MLPSALHAQAAVKRRGPVCKSEPPKFQVALNQYTTAGLIQGKSSVCALDPRRGRYSRWGGEVEQLPGLRPVPVWITPGIAQTDGMVALIEVESV